MSLAAKLVMRQSQALVMTPQLMQSIKLLQLTTVELERFIDEEIEKNPLLARAEGSESQNETRPEPEPAASEDWFDADGERLSAEAVSLGFDASLENIFPDDPGRAERLGPDLSSQWKSAGNGSASLDPWDMDDLAGAAPTMREVVGEQIAFRFTDSAQRMAAELLADELDEAGYCRAECGEIAARLSLRPEEVEAVLAACQGFEPAGLFARDLAECLALQLGRRNRLDPAMQALLSRLDLLAKRDFASLRRLCGVGEEDLLDMLAEIRALDPRPGAGFGGGHADAVIADVEVRAAPDGSWAVELNGETLPRLLVDQTYYAQVSRLKLEATERAFMSDCLQSANWLARSLDQRARTILKVATEIVRRQDGFLAHGVRHLKPMTLRDVAESIAMHESTISRVTANKYMLTPRGVFELRFFFSAAIASAEGRDAHSALAVQDRIRELIAAETPAEVLSDDAIVVALKKNGVDIARRTVAKYREGLNIPSSVERRREKRALAGVGR
ncbi:MAG: RNA polymerase factor sigma-54 [Methylobacterium mesophilicum]|nr:RNA polymerase factor sigma-54 [Methylobacterium mesophilicum]